jgi:hypothetical protein
LNLDESLTIYQSSQALPGAPLPWQSLGSRDRFQTVNQFIGGQVGTDATYLRGPWLITARAQVAFGAQFSSLDIQGLQTLFPPAGSPSFFGGGLLALPSNIGVHHRERFAVVPEAGLDLGYQFTPCFRVFVGYNLLYESSVLRVGQQIDATLSASTIPNFLPPGTPAPLTVGPNRPEVFFHDTSYWVQGLTIGVDLRY